MIRNVLIIIGIFMILPLWSQENNQNIVQDKSGWNFDVTPYVWLAGIKADVGFRDTDLGQVQADFSDILKNLKMGFFVHAEASKGKWYIMGDLMYLKLQKGGQLDIIDIRTEIKVKEIVTELGGGYNFVNNEGVFLVDGLVGLRHLNIATQVDIGSQIGIDRTINTNHPFIGARFKIKSESWLFNMRADVGGFGVKSQSSFKLNLLGAYKYSELFSLYFGVQALDFDFERDDLNLDLLSTGLTIGGNFHF